MSYRKFWWIRLVVESIVVAPLYHLYGLGACMLALIWLMTDYAFEQFKPERRHA